MRTLDDKLAEAVTSNRQQPGQSDDDAITGIP